AARRASAAGFALAGRWDKAAALARDAAGPDARTLAVLAGFLASGGRKPPAVADGEWAGLRQACAGAPEPLAALVGDPGPAAAEGRAGFWLRRADLGRADTALVEAQRGAPFDPTLIRAGAVVAYLRAARDWPRVDAAAWRDLIAQLACLLETPRWLD